MTRPRTIESIHPALPASDGAGVRLSRNIATPSLQRRLDPFLMLDEFRSDDPNDYIAGFPSHPHRGFETVTYMLEGAMRHRDSAGNEGVLRSGGIQWMKAARGVIHSEMPEQVDGLMQGFQLWINLPSREKMDPPRYEEMGAERIPTVARPDGSMLRVVSGEFDGARGPIEARATEPIYLDVTLPEGNSLELPTPLGHNALIYVFDGAVEVEGRRIGKRELGVLGDGESVRLSSRDGAARLLFLAGKPIGEPIIQYGPFVMNSKAEIEQAFSDYRDGRLA